MRRRDILELIPAAGVLGLAGCSGDDGNGNGDQSNDGGGGDQLDLAPAEDRSECPPGGPEEATAVIPDGPDGFEKGDEETTEIGDQVRHDVFYTGPDGEQFVIALRFRDSPSDATDYAESYGGFSLGSEGSLDAWIVATQESTVYTFNGPTGEYRDEIVRLYDAMPCVGPEHVVETRF